VNIVSVREYETAAS